jgi:hypothetical protein
MQDATVGSQDALTAGYSLQEAAALLGIGVNTLRRRIAAGQVQAEQVQRPQGYVWRVYLDGRHPPTEPTIHPPRQDATGSLPHPPTQLAQAEALASLIQATLTPIIAPLVGQLDAQRQTIERQAERVAELERENGRLSAELEARTAPQTVEPATEPPDRPLRLWQPWWVILGTVVIAIVLVVAWLAWPR